MSDSNQVELEWVESIAVLRLSADRSSLPVLTQERMNSLRARIEELASNDSVKGVLILGADETGFCAGADVNAIRDVKDPITGEQLAKEGQALFQKIAELPFPSVALIHGPCVGGGFELALACTYRVALNTLDTRVGLPEIKLGILPGFGGTVRLPRLIGLPKALEIILNGRVISAVRGKNSGMVDYLVEPVSEDKAGNVSALLEAGQKLLSGELSIVRAPLGFAEKCITNYSLGRFIARRKAKSGIMQETGGKYPAPLRALDVTIDGLAQEIPKALDNEARALGELIVTAESKSLVHIYFCSEAASKLGRSLRKEVKGAPVGVLGAGVMGSGIAAVFLFKGHPVTLLDTFPEARERARSSITKFLKSRRGLSQERQQELLSNLQITDSMSDLSECSLVVEAIIEDLDIKRDTLKSLAEVVSGDCVIASNTSSLRVNDIAEHVPIPERVIGMHFFNPAEKMPLVEIVRAESTSDRALALVAAFAAGIDKYPVVVDDVPGFLVNRILSSYIAEAGRLLSEGVSIAEIDKAACDFGMPMGPFRMLDEVGLDVASKVQEEMTKAYGERMNAPEYPKRLVASKRFGKKSKHGFYSYETSTPIVDDGVYELLGMRPVQVELIEKSTIQDRLILSLVQEAIRCLDEEVAGAPGQDSAGQLDLATVMGMGFAPFRGGVLFYADSLGVPSVIARLRELETRYGPRFAPVDGLRRRESTKAGLFTSTEAAV